MSPITTQEIVLALVYLGCLLLWSVAGRRKVIVAYVSAAGAP